MLLPPRMFDNIAEHFDHHTCWHLARMRSQDVLRAKFSGECAKQLRGRHEIGSGCDFLAFHRRMMRHFGWLLARALEPKFKFEPWPGHRLPRWVEDAVIAYDGDFDFAVCYATITQLAGTGNIENLGGFIEPNEAYDQKPGAGLHAKVHRGIDQLERRLYGGDETATMDDLGRSPGNIFFWTLHGWIDDWYARCEEKAGIQPVRSPLEMPHFHIHCEGRAPLPE